MLQVGKIKKYNEERGFGFIEVEETKQELFFHIKDFSKGKAPQIGERLTFNTQQYENKLKATNIIRLDFPNQQQKSRSKSNFKEKDEQSSILGIIFTISIASIITYLIYGYIQDSIHRNELAAQPVTTETLHIANQNTQNSSNSSNFKCDGRVHCSQMTSKDEAVYFINHCPGTKMDGDGDGDPCEQQFGSRW